MAYGVHLFLICDGITCQLTPRGDRVISSLYRTMPLANLESERVRLERYAIKNNWVQADGKWFCPECRHEIEPSAESPDPREGCIRTGREFL